MIFETIVNKERFIFEGNLKREMRMKITKQCKSSEEKDKYKYVRRKKIPEKCKKKERK